jgi:cell division septum initiation protein DivIVA
MMKPETQPTPVASGPVVEDLLQERDALRDEVEGLKAAVDTVMRALKVALKEHNAARMREAVLIDLLRQSESECSEARALLRRCQSALPAGGRDAARLIEEIGASTVLVDAEEDVEGEDVPA